ncbi:MAG: hypothetical protein V4543_17975 [Bacteroidota bacterium]
MTLLSSFGALAQYQQQQQQQVPIENEDPNVPFPGVPFPEPGYIPVYSTNGTFIPSTFYEEMSSGFIGLGTTSPMAQFHLSGSQIIDDGSLFFGNDGTCGIKRYSLSGTGISPNSLLFTLNGHMPINLAPSGSVYLGDGSTGSKVIIGGPLSEICSTGVGVSGSMSVFQHLGEPSLVLKSESRSLANSAWQGFQPAKINFQNAMSTFSLEHLNWVGGNASGPGGTSGTGESTPDDGHLSFGYQKGSSEKSYPFTIRPTWVDAGGTAAGAPAEGTVLRSNGDLSVAWKGGAGSTLGSGYLYFGSSTGNSIHFSGAESNSSKFLLNVKGSQKMVVDGDGNMGIGTPNPLARIHAVNNADHAVLQLETNTADKAGCLKLRRNTQPGTPGYLPKEWNLTGPEAGVPNDGLVFRYYNGQPEDPKIPLFLSSDGKVGVSNLAPQANLDVTGWSRISNPTGESAVQIEATSALHPSMLKLRRSAQAPDQLPKEWNFSGPEGDGDGLVLRYFNGTTEPAKIPMFISAEGKVGINNATPSANLQVTGNALVDNPGADPKLTLKSTYNSTHGILEFNNNVSNWKLMHFDWDQPNNPDGVDNHLDFSAFTGNNFKGTPLKLRPQGVEVTGSLTVNGVSFTGGWTTDVVPVEPNGSAVLNVIQPTIVPGTTDQQYVVKLGKHAASESLVTWNLQKSSPNATNTDSKYLLSVDGLAVFEKAVISHRAYWPDFVFDPKYKLGDLHELSNYVNTNKHLPEIPSAKEIEEHGIDLGEMNAKLLQKVEELTLYLIKQEERMDAMQKQMEGLKTSMDKK